MLTARLLTLGDTLARWWLHPLRLTLLVLLAWALRLVVLVSAQARGIEETLLVDDAFYYFRIAFNLTRGMGSTFDGLAPTNGYHPLWMAMLLPVFALAWTPLDGVVWAAALGATVWSIGGLVAAALARRLFSAPLSALVFTLIYLFLPQLVLRSLDGLETSLVVVCYLAFFWWIARGLSNPTRAFYAVYGLLAGLLFLARTDAAIVVVAMSLGVGLALVLVCREVKPLAGLGLAGIVALLVAAPWLVWNGVTFGQIVQTSGTALTFLYQRYAEEVNFWGQAEFLELGLGIFVHSLTQQLLHAGLWVGGYPEHLWMGIVAALAYAGLLAVLLQVTWKHMRGYPSCRWVVLSVPIGFLLLTLIHTVVRWSPREWYYAPTILATYAGLIYLGEQRLRLFVNVALLALLGGWLVSYGRPWQWHGLYTNQTYAFERLKGLDETCFPEGVRVGSSDAGIRSVLWDRVTVVNLDGLVNAHVIEAYRSSGGLSYLDAANIDYVEVKPVLVQPTFWGETIRLRLDPIRCGVYTSDLTTRNPHDSLLFRVLRSDDEVLSAHIPLSRSVRPGDLSSEKYLGFGWQPLNQAQPARRVISQTARLLLPLPASSQPYTLTLVASSARLRDQAEFEVRFNGEHIGVVPLREMPHRAEVLIPSRLVKTGINRLDLEIQGVSIPKPKPQRLAQWMHPGYFDPYAEPQPGWLDPVPEIYVWEVRVDP